LKRPWSLRKEPVSFEGQRLYLRLRCFRSGSVLEHVKEPRFFRTCGFFGGNPAGYLQEHM